MKDDQFFYGTTYGTIYGTIADYVVYVVFYLIGYRQYRWYRITQLLDDIRKYNVVYKTHSPADGTYGTLGTGTHTVPTRPTVDRRSGRPVW